MDDRVRWLDYKGKRVLLSDLSNLRGQELVDVAEETERVIFEHGKKDILSLVDVTDAHVFGPSLGVLKKVRQNLYPYALKTAVIGISGAKAVLLQAVDKVTKGRESKVFRTRKEAMEYLVE